MCRLTALPRVRPRRPDSDYSMGKRGLLRLLREVGRWWAPPPRLSVLLLCKLAFHVYLPSRNLRPRSSSVQKRVLYRCGAPRCRLQSPRLVEQRVRACGPWPWLSFLFRRLAGRRRTQLSQVRRLGIWHATRHLASGVGDALGWMDRVGWWAGKPERGYWGQAISSVRMMV